MAAVFYWLIPAVVAAYYGQALLMGVFLFGAAWQVALDLQGQPKVEQAHSRMTAAVNWLAHPFRVFWIRCLYAPHTPCMRNRLYLLTNGVPFLVVFLIPQRLVVSLMVAFGALNTSSVVVRVNGPGLGEGADEGEGLEQRPSVH